jgi:hypothetical protein
MPYKKVVGAIKLRQAGYLMSLNQELEHLENKFCTSTVQILALWDLAE